MSDIKIYFTMEEIDTFQKYSEAVTKSLDEFIKSIVKVLSSGDENVLISFLENMADTEELIKEMLYIFWRWFAIRGIDEDKWKTEKKTDKKPVISFNERVRARAHMYNEEGYRKMTDREKCVLKRDENIILCHYKFIPQVGQLKEELAELIEAADGYIKNTDTEEHFVEEMADVEVMIDQMKIYFNAWDRVNCKKREKVDRQLKRIEAEKNV